MGAHGAHKAHSTGTHLALPCLLNFEFKDRAVVAKTGLTQQCGTWAHEQTCGILTQLNDLPDLFAQWRHATTLVQGTRLAAHEV